MQPVTLSSEVLQSVSAARKCALESRYDAALQLYATADAAIEASLQTLDDNAICTDLALLQTKLAEEADLAREIHGELRAMVDPATAVRRDRGDASMPQSTRQGMHSSPKFNNTDDGNRSRVVKRSPTQQDPISALNQKWYGDKDRFGPPDGPIIPSPSLLSKRSTSARCAAPARRYASVPTSRPIVSTRRTVPKTGECGSQAAVQERRSKKGSGPVRFTGRAGEEELVQLIEADMHTGALPVTWDDIAGVKEAKHLLEEAVVYPVLMPNYYQGIRRPWKGVLMYGPPGTGKTMLAKAVASECGTTFFNISPATLTSKWRGESEKLIRVLFEMARHYAPSTIFIDEIDSLCGQRGGGEEHEASRRAKGTLLAQMDGVGVDQGKIVMVLGATNHPWDIDEAMRRRLEKRIYIPLPDYADRVELFKINTASLKLSSDVDFEKLSRVLDGHYYSGADITNIVRDAAMMTMRRYMHEADKTMLKEHAAEIGRRVAEQPTTMDDFMCAIKKVPSSINVENINKFEKWKKEFELNI